MQLFQSSCGSRNVTEVLRARVDRETGSDAVDPEGGNLLLSDYPEMRALRGETVAPGIDFHVTDGGGTDSLLRVSAAPYRGDDGQILGAVVRLEDISEDVRVAGGAREDAARLQAAVNLVGLGLYSWNPRTNELQCDDAVRAMWGLPSGATVEHSFWRSAIHTDDLSRVDDALQHCLDPSSDGVYNVEYRVVGADGVERWVATGGLTTFEADEAVEFYGVVMDITQRRHAEDALEQRVEAQTRELNSLNRQLREQIVHREAAEAIALRLNRLNAIGQTASGIAHDFNNLIAVVLSNVQLLMRSVQDPDDREGLELIRSAAKRGAKVAAQLVAYARQQQLELQAVDLNATITGMSDLLRATMGANIHLEISLQPDLNLAMVDPTQAEMILLNLAINASHAMEGAGKLIIRTFNIATAMASQPEHPPAGEYAAILVEDTGSGIADDVLGHVFEPFFTTKTSGEGAGLGLAQVLGVLKQSGGGIGIETRVGVGTSVTVYLPVAKGSDGSARHDERQPNQ